MARYKLILAYDGSAFAGSQRQAPGTRSRTDRRLTVQGALEDALRGLGWKSRAILMAGRTDAGAHASGQVAAIDLEWAHAPEELRDALNARLPFELAVHDVAIIGPNFHPRFDAVSRRYRYSLFCRHERDPLHGRFAWRVWPSFDPEVLIQISAVFVGQHDFGAFGTAPVREAGTVRTLSLSAWREVGPDGMWQFNIVANAFLYRMVRRLVFIQVAAAQGRCSIDAVRRALERGAGSGELPAGLAPAHGLELVEVNY